MCGIRTARDSIPTRLQKLLSGLLQGLFFYFMPLFLKPFFSGFLIALSCTHNRLLASPANFFQDSAHAGQAIFDAEFAQDKFRNARKCPNFPSISEMLRPQAEKLTKFIQLFIGKFARLFCDLPVSEGIESILPIAGKPLADSSFCDAKSPGNIHLFHAAFEKLDCPQPPEFPHVLTFAALCFHRKRYNSFFRKSLGIKVKISNFTINIIVWIIIYAFSHFLLIHNFINLIITI